MSCWQEVHSSYFPWTTFQHWAFLLCRSYFFYGTVSRDKFKKFWQKFTELGLTKGPGWTGQDTPHTCREALSHTVDTSLGSRPFHPSRWVYSWDRAGHWTCWKCRKYVNPHDVYFCLEYAYPISYVALFWHVGTRRNTLEWEQDQTETNNRSRNIQMKREVYIYCMYILQFELFVLVSFCSLWNDCFAK